MGLGKAYASRSFFLYKVSGGIQTETVHALIMVKSEKKSEEIYVHPLKLKAGKERDPFKILMQEDGDAITFTFGGEFEEQELKIEQTKEFILARIEEATESMDTKELIQALAGQAGKTNVENALREMRKNNEIGFDKIGQKYVYRKPLPDLNQELEAGGGNEVEDPLPSLDYLPSSPLGS